MNKETLMHECSLETNTIKIVIFAIGNMLHGDFGIVTICVSWFYSCRAFCVCAFSKLEHYPSRYVFGSFAMYWWCWLMMFFCVFSFISVSTKAQE